ncbi:MAG TPA: hypothetical protein VK960_05160 [Acidimicrobiia bacterium]|nr:hypothetical protein [Acidimicrobiia bacterium]
MRGKSSRRSARRTRARVIWVVTSLVAFLLASAAPSGAAPDDKSYTVGVDLERVCTSDTVTLTFTFLNTSTTSTQDVRGARLTVPSGYTGISAATPVTSGGEIWVSSVSGNTVTLIADNAGTGTDQGIPPNGTVTVAVTLTAPATTGTATFVTAADQNSNFGGGGNAFFRVGPDPEVSVVDCELVLTASPDPVFAGDDIVIDAEVVDAANKGAGPVLSFSGDLDWTTSPSGCSEPPTGTTSIASGSGSFTLLALFGDADDLCTVDGTVKGLNGSVTFEVEGSAANCAQGQALCETDTEVSADSIAFAYVFCEDCKDDTVLVADYLEDRCIEEDCKALFLADSSTALQFFVDITVTGVPRGQVTIVADLGAGLVEVGSCSNKSPEAPCIVSVTGMGDTNTWRVLLATDPPIGVRYN